MLYYIHIYKTIIHITTCVHNLTYEITASRIAGSPVNCIPSNRLVFMLDQLMKLLSRLEDCELCTLKETII